MKKTLISGAAALFVTSVSALAQSPTTFDLSFANPVQATNGNYAGLGNYYSGLTYDFLNVAPTSGVNIGIRVTVSNITPNYGFVGSFPNYSTSSGEPSGDLGYMFQYTGPDYSQGGVTYTLEFFEGADFTNPYTIGAANFLIYDVDGERDQSESVRVFRTDGLVSYRLSAATGGIYLEEDTGNSLLFTGPGVNVAETNATGAVIFRYENTSRITFGMEANTTGGGVNNGVFAAIDGDLSLLQGDDSAFLTPVFTAPVPEPSSLALLGMAALGATFLKRKRRIG